MVPLNAQCTIAYAVQHVVRLAPCHRAGPESSLQAFFSDHGIVEDVILMYDRETRRPRGFGFVTFSTEEPVEKLVATRFVDLNGKSVEIKAALPKSTIGDRGGRGPRFGQQGNRNQYPYSYGGGYGQGQFAL